MRIDFLYDKMATKSFGFTIQLLQLLLQLSID